VREERPELSLLLTGAQFARFHDKSGVIASGFVSTRELAWLYRNAMALVMPSLDEGFGLPALEAMASGTAVITSKHPALVELTGSAALHAEATSVDEIAAAMGRVAADASLRDSLARSGIERAREFTWERCAIATRDVYARVLAM
jgi:alpha-1,3-rhamnosyl/mannosyltransferase